MKEVERGGTNGGEKTITGESVEVYEEKEG